MAERNENLKDHGVGRSGMNASVEWKSEWVDGSENGRGPVKRLEWEVGADEVSIKMKEMSLFEQ